VHRAFLLGAVVLVGMAGPGWADVFDRYNNPLLSKVCESDSVQEIKKLTPELIGKHGKLTDSGGTMLVVKTSGGRNAKLVVQEAQQRAGDKTIPMLLIERFVCFKPEQDQAKQAAGQTIHLYNGFQFSLDLGQVVPADVGGDLRFVADGTWGYVEPVGKAKLYLVTKHLPGTEAIKAAKPTIGETFDPQYFNGTYRLHDNGRRTAKLTLKIEADGTVSGEYISDDTGRSYDVYGKIQSPKHQIQFFVKFPQTEQSFQGFLFTKDAQAICGSSRMQDREFGFYALRSEEK
jgi:hypothetical protein